MIKINIEQQTIKLPLISFHKTSKFNWNANKSLTLYSVFKINPCFGLLEQTTHLPQPAKHPGQ